MFILPLELRDAPVKLDYDHLTSPDDKCSAVLLEYAQGCCLQEHPTLHLWYLFKHSFDTDAREPRIPDIQDLVASLLY
jgi:hypothetical protein